MELPRPNVKVNSTTIGNEYITEISISRDGDDSGKTYRGSSESSRSGAIKSAVEKLLGDGYTAEWLPGPVEKL